MKITLNNCGKNYHRSWLFKDITLTIPIDSTPGSTLKLALLGPNGAGKSTFTLLLAGQTDPTEGVVQWHDTSGKSIPQSQWHKYVALASPGMELPEEFTLSEWFDFHQQIKGFQSGITKELILTLCGFPKNTLTKQILTFSSGMKQRVKLCAAVLGNQPLVILDEPLTNLDSAGQLVFTTLLSEYLNNRSFIIASNRPDEWRDYCTQTYTIGDSEIKAI
jgi:ABC-type multidrug transport system ATPase subunit